MTRATPSSGAAAIGARRPPLASSLPPEPRQSHSLLAHLVAFGLGALGFGLYAALRGQESDYDLLNYHYYSAYAFLNHRLGFDYAPAQLQTYLNPLVFVPFYVLSQHLAPVLVGFASGAVQGLAFGLVFALAFRLLADCEWRQRTLLALLAAMLGAYGPVLIASVGGTSSDATLNPVNLLAVYVAVMAFTPARAGRAVAFPWLGLSAFLFGLSAGLKWVEGMYFAGFGLAVLAAGGSWRFRLAAVGLSACSFAAGVALTGGFWMATLWQHFRSPLFPFFNAVFRSPHYVLENFTDANYLPSSWWRHLTYPFAFLTKSTITERTQLFRDARYAVILVLVVGLAVRRMVGHRRGSARSAPASTSTRAPSAPWFVILFFVFAYALWQARFSILRYAITLESIGGLVMVLGIRQLFGQRTARLAALLCAAGITLLVMRPCVFGRSAWGRELLAVEAPTFEQPAEVLVLIAHNRPFAFVIPFFQPEVRFVAVKNNFTKPTQRTRYQDEVSDLIAKHAGPIFLLALPDDVAEDTATLAAYHLTVSSSSYVQVANPAYPAGFGLWLLARVPR